MFYLEVAQKKLNNQDDIIIQENNNEVRAIYLSPTWYSYCQ